MSKKLYEESDVQAIANAIREKNGLTDTYTISQMAAAVLAISSVADHTEEDAIITRTITEYSNDRVTSVGNSAFYNLTTLISVNFPNVTTIGENAFYRCLKLETTNFPNAITCDYSAFYSCQALKLIDFMNVKNLRYNVFGGCTNLRSLVLRSNSICSLMDTGVFKDTPIKSGTGYIYVPSALIDTYKTATNWVTFANQFRALEDYTVDGTTTGKLDESKVNV